jgi:iron complex transport system permease protein
VAVAAVVLSSAALALVALWLTVDVAGDPPPSVVARGVLAAFGIGTPLERGLQTILELRLWRALAGAGVGAALALSGAYLQGLFRNGLASPSVLGVTSGAVLGASVAIAFIGGYGPALLMQRTGLLSPVLVTAAAFAGALATSFFLLALASRRGRLSVTTLLLGGIAINTLCGGLLAALQSLTLDDFEVSRALLTWTFGTLTDRSGWQVALVWSGLLLAAAIAPFVAVELDLLAAGEEDALALGVSVQRVKVLVLFATSLATGAAVAVAGQIAFVGLIVPHLVRAVVGPSHRTLLLFSMLAGAVFLLAGDLGQRLAFRGSGLQPGVLMSLLGGPFFLVLLVRSKRLLSAP